MAEVDRLTIPEYNIMMEAYQLKLIDRDYLIHWQAFLNLEVQGKKKAGKYKEKPVYSSFDKFFDYEENLRRIGEKNKKPSERFKGIGKLLKNGGA